MQITFFATDIDLLEIAGWMLDMPATRLFESFSSPDLPNQQFTSVHSIAQLFTKPSWSLAAWHGPTGAEPKPQFIEFSPETREKMGKKGRTVLRSPSTIEFVRNNEQQGCLANSYISCWEATGARQRAIYTEEDLDAVDWKCLRSTMLSIQNKIKRLSPGTLRSYPIMNDAFCKLTCDGLKLWNWGSACTASSPLVTKI